MFKLIIAFLLVSSSALAAMPQEGISMHGQPKYAAGFSHFDYVNPKAPKGGELRFGVVGSFDSLNPFIIRGISPKGPAFSLSSATVLYEPLMARSWDEPFSLYGLIAKSVEVPPDRSEIIFNLREEARWHDGKSIMADDVLFSFKSLRDKGRPHHRAYYKKVEKVEKLGPRRVRFAFKKEPSGKYDLEMPLIMGLMPILPRHDWEGRDFNKTSLRIPLVSGPYKIASVDVGRSLILERDPTYWGRDLAVQKGMCNFDRVRFDYYRDDAVTMEAFLSGGFDLRRESDPRKWVKMKKHPAVKEGRLSPVLFKHHRTEAISGFVMNLRRPLFKDPALREAAALAFDFSWINKALLYNMGKRTESFFPNSELAAPKDPQKKKIVGRRNQLLRASTILKEAGYVLREGKLYTPDGKAVSFEVMLSDPTEEKTALEWARGLRRLGIEARVRTVDSAQYQERLTGFDYDVVRTRWFNSLSPGNEQMNYWSCLAAKTTGSRNYIGLCDPEIDRLAAAIPAASSRKGLIETTQKLDRALTDGNYVVPFYYFGADPIAFFSKRLAHPKEPPLYGPILETWWAVGGNK